MRVFLTIVVTAGLVLAFVSGYTFGKWKKVSSKIVVSNIQSEVASKENPPSLSGDASISAPSGDSASVRAIQGASSALHALATLRDLHPNAVRISVVTRRDRIEDGFASLLEIPAADVEGLNAALQSARTKLNALSAANARISIAEDDTISISVPALEGGAQVYDELMDAFDARLGEQSVSFRKLLGEQLSEVFHNFGAEERTLTVARTLPGYVDWKDGGIYAKDERRTSTGKLETIAHRFMAHRMEYLLPHLQWIEPLIGDRLRAESATTP